MSETTKYTYLAPREGSRYEQYFFQGRNLRAETLYRATLGRNRCRPKKWPRTTMCRSLLSSRPFNTQSRMPRFFNENGKKTGKKATPEVLLNRRL